VGIHPFIPVITIPLVKNLWLNIWVTLDRNFLIIYNIYMKLSDLINQVVFFEWDNGNINKNWQKHKVKPSECEDVFFNEPIIEYDRQHSQKEERYFAYGKTMTDRLLFIVFTIRRDKIRVISARDMERKERSDYHEKNTQIQK